MTTLMERLPNAKDNARRMPGRLPLSLTMRAISHSVWKIGKTVILSTLENAELPDGSGNKGPQWHISISSEGQRATDKECAKALKSFGLLKAEEDNHHPGRARHFWLPIDPAARVDCECKTSEVQVTEEDGYTWSNARQDMGACRACEIAPITKVPCKWHNKDLWNTMVGQEVLAEFENLCKLKP